MAKVGIPCSTVRAAATASFVESGLEAQSTMSAPPALSVTIRFAVSLVTWRHADTRSPLSCFSARKRSRIRSKTGISRAAQSMSAWPSLARARSFTSPLVAVKLDLTPDIVPGEYLATLEAHKLHQEPVAGDLPAEHLDQLTHRPGGSAGGNEVVHDEHSLARPDRVLVGEDRVVAVFEGVGDGPGGEGQLARLADRDEAGPELLRHRAAEDEAAGLHGG